MKQNQKGAEDEEALLPSQSPPVPPPPLTTPVTRPHAVWTPGVVVAAVVLVVGTTAAALLNQHVANTVPTYVFSISVFSPFVGLVVYPIITVTSHKAGAIKIGLTRANFGEAFSAMVPVALCFALNNVLLAFGTSGRGSGKPDVPTVLALVLQKLVVPVSLTVESFYDWHRPRVLQVVGVILVVLGGVVAALAYRDGAAAGGHGPSHDAKVFCIVLASLPLATGFLLVKRATGIVSRVSEFELWAVLCLPETVFSIGLAYAAQAIRDPGISRDEMSSTLWAGLKCIAIGRDDSPVNGQGRQCSDAATYTWVGLIPGFAFNLAIPVLVRLLGDSTVVPLLRAVALPLAALLAMAYIDPVIATPFSWDGVAGLLLAFAGLIVCYLPPRVVNRCVSPSTPTSSSIQE